MSNIISLGSSTATNSPIATSPPHCSQKKKRGEKSLNLPLLSWQWSQAPKLPKKFSLITIQGTLVWRKERPFFAPCSRLPEQRGGKQVGTGRRVQVPLVWVWAPREGLGAGPTWGQFVLAPLRLQGGRSQWDAAPCVFWENRVGKAPTAINTNI